MRYLTLPIAVITVLAMPAQEPFQTKGGDVPFISLERSAEISARSLKEITFEGRYRLFVQFDHVLDREERKTFEASGIRFVDPFSNAIWLISVPANTPIGHLASLMPLRGSYLPEAQHKLHPELKDLIDHATSRDQLIDVVISPYRDVPMERLLIDRQFAAIGAMRAYPSSAFLEANVSIKDLQGLSTHPAIQWIEERPEPGEPEDLRGITFHRVNELRSGLQGAPGLNGNDVHVCVNDDGYVGPHIDVRGRTEQVPVQFDLVGDHGDMVTGILAGAGNLDPTKEGMAPGAFVHVRQYNSSLPYTMGLYLNEGAVIFSTSYSNGCNDGYTAITQQVDQEIIDQPAILQVFSAGNSNGQNCGYGAGSTFGNITGGHKIAKNCIATANLIDTGGLVGSSSRGPSADGRIKPDLAAYGNGQLSLDPNNGYSTGSGTSAAAPGISGCAAVLYEGWRELNNGDDPKSGLIKALMMNTAEDLGNPGPDYSFGWGRVNTSRAWKAMNQGRFMTGSVDQTAQVQHIINVPTGTAELRVMLYWMDPAASIQAASALVNDLDLTAVDANATTHLPWLLSNVPDAALLSAPAGNGNDRSNNVEQVAVTAPVPGDWTFTITGFDVPAGPQEYFLVYEFIPQRHHLVYPIGNEHWVPNSGERIRWDALSNGTDFNLALSLDSGSTWQNLTPAGPDIRFVDMTVPDTTTARAMFRIERNGIVEQSAPLTIMPVASGLEVIRNCPDSAHLIWDRMDQASGYIVHALGARYMDSVAFTTDTNFVFTGLSPVHDDWYAITAIGPNGEVSRRSIAVPRPQALVDCTVQFDLIAETIDAPGAAHIDCQPTDEVVRLAVRNIGDAQVNGFESGYVVNNDPAVIIQVPDTLQPGDSLHVEFPQTQLGLNPGIFNLLRVWARSGLEDYPNNDTLAQQMVSNGVTATIPYFEDMEDLDICDETGTCTDACVIGPYVLNELNGVVDQLDWRVDSAGTPSSGTGPVVDHTLGTNEGQYLYIEATGPCSGQTALLRSPCIALPSSDPAQLLFWYHMDGPSMGDLHVDVYSNGQWNLDAMTPIAGDQGDQWHQAIVDLSGYAGQIINFRIRGITGINHISDMAVDDIQVTTATGISELEQGGELQLLPTGSAGQYELLVPPALQQGATLQVFDVHGRLLLQDATTRGYRTTINIAQATPGVYMVRVDKQDLMRSLRFVHGGG